MLGDGVNQYASSMMTQDEHLFRAVPHRLSVQSGSGERVWYGRMVLPPSDAVHPLHQRTFGDLRQELIANPQESLGCSSGFASLVAARERSLQTDQVKNSTAGQATAEEMCNNDAQFYCWHRCMNYTELVSPTACEAVATSDAPHEVACHNHDTNELWPGTHDPDYELGCVASSVVAAFKQNASIDHDDDHPQDHDHDHDHDHDENNTSYGSDDGKGGTAAAVLLGSLFCF
jgi:hypothetical protein